MKDKPKVIMEYETAMSEQEFLECYNRDMPEGYPHVTLELLQKFKDSHMSLFKTKSTWNLDQHRKPLITWIPQNR